MFSECRSLKTIQLSDDFKVQKNTKIAGIFSGCDSLSENIKRKFKPEDMNEEEWNYSVN